MAAAANGLTTVEDKRAIVAAGEKEEKTLLNSESVAAAAAAAGEKGSIRVTAPGLTSHLSKLTSSRPAGRPGTMAAGPETCAGYFWRRNFRAPETARVTTTRHRRRPQKDVGP